MKANPEHRQWHEWFAQFTDGTITPADRDRLEHLLSENTEARGLWFLHNDIEIGLADWAAEQRALNTAKLSGSLGWKAVFPTFFRSRFTRTLGWGLAIAAVLAIAALVTTRQQNTREQPATGVAVLSRAVAVEWMDESEASPVGSLLGPGTLRFKSGAVLLEFCSGARVVVEGPAELRLVSPSLAFLQQGRIHAVVPPQARGFTVSLPDFKIVDLGTEFGLATNPFAPPEIHVFDGLVEVASRSSATIRTLVKGQALALTRDLWRNIPLSHRGFLTEQELARWDSLSKKERLALSRHSSNILSSNPSALVHFLFDESNPVERVLANAAVHAGEGTFGSIVGSVWNEGRWPGKASLRFRGAGDRVRFTVAEPLQQVTLLAWIRFDALPTGLQSLCSSDLEESGAMRWEMTQDSRLRLAIGRDTGNKKPAWHAMDSAPLLSPALLDQWILLVTTFDGKKVQHYFNGRPCGSTSPIQPGSLLLGPATLGNWNGDCLRALTGAMDEFAVLSTALTPEQIQELYQNGKP